MLLFADWRHIVIAVRNPSLPLLLLSSLLLAACAAPRVLNQQSNPAPPSSPVKSSSWNGIFSCTAHVDGKLPAITWRRIPFRQEGDRLTGLYRFTDHFKHQDSYQVPMKVTHVGDSQSEADVIHRGKRVGVCHGCCDWGSRGLRHRAIARAGEAV